MVFGQWQNNLQSQFFLYDFPSSEWEYPTISDIFDKLFSSQYLWSPFLNFNCCKRICAEGCSDWNCWSSRQKEFYRIFGIHYSAHSQYGDRNSLRNLMYHSRATGFTAGPGKPPYIFPSTGFLVFMSITIPKRVLWGYSGSPLPLLRFLQFSLYQLHLGKFYSSEVFL